MDPAGRWADVRITDVCCLCGHTFYRHDGDGDGDGPYPCDDCGCPDFIGPVSPTRLPVCIDCGHRHGADDDCPDHVWDNDCPYEGVDCAR